LFYRCVKVYLISTLVLFDYLALYNHSTHKMFQLGPVSEDILDKDFVCNLSACKGACCVDGDAGAPLSLRN
jgi:hypothetical protein